MDQLVKFGHDRCQTAFKDEIFKIRSLTGFSFVDDVGMERGKGIQDRAKQLLELLSNVDFQESEKKEGLELRSKVQSATISNSSVSNTGNNTGNKMGGIGTLGGNNSTNTPITNTNSSLGNMAGISNLTPFSSANVKRQGNNKKDDFWNKVDTEKQPKKEIIQTDINIFEQSKEEKTKTPKKDEESIDLFSSGEKIQVKTTNNEGFDFDNNLNKDQKKPRRDSGNEEIDFLDSIMDVTPTQQDNNSLDFMMNQNQNQNQQQYQMNLNNINMMNNNLNQQNMQ